MNNKAETSNQVVLQGRYLSKDWRLVQYIPAPILYRLIEEIKLV